VALGACAWAASAAAMPHSSEIAAAYAWHADNVSKALQLLNTIHAQRPELVAELVAKLMWQHPIATCTALAVGRSTVDAALVARAAQRSARPADSPFCERVQEALLAFLSGHVAAGCADPGVHGFYVRLLALGGLEDELVRCVPDAGMHCIPPTVLAPHTCDTLCPPHSAHPTPSQV
jgi:hypothetical protein